MSDIEDNDAIDALLELDAPDGVREASNAVEIVRGWIGDGSLLVSLNPDVFDDRIGEWGRVFGQLAHHVARSAALGGRMSEAEALAAIRQSFNGVLPLNQSTISGEVRGRVRH
jgi:hypothetical protein